MALLESWIYESFGVWARLLYLVYYFQKAGLDWMHEQRKRHRESQIGLTKPFV